MLILYFKYKKMIDCNKLITKSILFVMKKIVSLKSQTFLLFTLFLNSRRLLYSSLDIFIVNLSSLPLDISICFKSFISVYYFLLYFFGDFDGLGFFCSTLFLLMSWVATFLGYNFGVSGDFDGDLYFFYPFCTGWFLTRTVDFCVWF